METINTKHNCLCGLTKAARLLILALALTGGGIASTARAVLTTLSYSPNPVDLADLEHKMAYTWRLDSLPTETIVSASLTFANIANADANANQLFAHLLDTAKNTGVSSFVDDASTISPITPLVDDFVNTRYHTNANWLVAPGTSSTKLFNSSFSTTPSDFTYTFNSAALAALNTYARNGGNIAFGFDPDCHYFNDGISFAISYNSVAGVSPIPEVNTTVALALVIGLAFGTHQWRRRPVAQPVSA